MRPVFILPVLLLIVSVAARAQYVLEPVADGGHRIRFTNATDGYIFGSSGIRRTTDGGVTWKTATANLPAATGCPDLVDGCFADRDHGWIVTANFSADSSFVCATTDGGATWHRQLASAISEVPYASHRFNSLCFLDNRSGWVAGKGIIKHTTDGGATWRTQLEFWEQSGNNDWFTSVQMMDEHTGWAAGYGGLIVHTTDGGTTWKLQHQDTAVVNGIIVRTDYYYIMNVRFADRSMGFAAANNGNFLRTTDGGDTWQERKTGFANDNCEIAVSGDVIWQVGGDYCDHRGCFAGQSLLFSRDGGVTWRSLFDTTFGYIGSNAQFTSIACPTGRVAYVATAWGQVYRIRDTTSIAGVAAPLPGSGRIVLPGIALQSLPNPAADVATIPFGALVSEATISLYDMYGRRVSSMRVQATDRAVVPVAGLAAGAYAVEATIDGVPAHGRIDVVR